MIIGVIGPEDSLNNIMQIQQEIDSSIELRYYGAFTVRDTLQVLDECQLHTDGILFTGRAVYDIAVSEGTLYKPHNYVVHDTSSVYLTLLKNYQNKEIPKRVSSDARNTHIAQDVLTLTGIEQYYVIKYKSHYTEDVYIDYHLKNWNAGLVDVIFTSFSRVYEYFMQKHIPVCRLYTTFSAIRNAIFHLSVQIKLAREQDAKIAVQIIKACRTSAPAPSYLDAAQSALKIQQAFMPYVQSIHGILIPLSTEEWMIVSNKGNITKTSSKNTLFQLLSTLDIQICSGIGIGSTVMEAEHNAKEACILSQKRKENTCFILHENHMIEGPILHQNSLKYNPREIDDKIKKLVEDTGLNASHIKKIQSIISIHGSDVFTSKDLADYMGISERSANRILKQLIQCGKAEITSRETISAGSGRPRNMIKIKF